LSWRIGLGQERKSGFRSRLPPQSTENFPNHHLAESQPSSDSAIADALGLEAQNRTVAWAGLGYSTRTLRRFQERLHSRGLSALVRPEGRPADGSLNRTSVPNRSERRIRIRTAKP